jgi:hypothetical protein
VTLLRYDAGEMEIELPSGAPWTVRGGGAKLSLRARLPGARVFDLVASSLRDAKARAMSPEHRFHLALPASWLVNSPAISVVLRRWALPPHLETCVALLEVLEDEAPELSFEERREAMTLAVNSLGGEPYVIEAVSKIFALLTPNRVPLMPAKARSFVLGEGEHDQPRAFTQMVEWFEDAVTAHRADLEVLARAHAEVALEPGGVLDRLLWFDSEGHRHFPPVG